MVNDLDFIGDINDKYAALELELEEKLETVVKRERALDPDEAKHNNRIISNKNKPEATYFSLDIAKRRNYELLKSLEISKARLRSRATFSPLEAILQKAIGSYLKETSLVPCSTKKLYGPTYV